MTERTRGLHTTGAQHEALDLIDLHASKPQESLNLTVTEPSSTDLSSASIQSIHVVRLSARPEKRTASSLNVSTAPDLDTSSETKQGRHAGTKRGGSHGILKNPHFPYQGGPVERLITLLANILKRIESSLLASLRPTTPPSPLLKKVITSKKRDSSGREVEEEEERSEEREVPLTIAPRQSD
jgi:hypothetical protein